MIVRPLEHELVVMFLLDHAQLIIGTLHESSLSEYAVLELVLLLILVVQFFLHALS
jgi:hypothetical protein